MQIRLALLTEFNEVDYDECRSRYPKDWYWQVYVDVCCHKNLKPTDYSYNRWLNRISKSCKTQGE